MVRALNVNSFVLLLAIALISANIVSANIKNESTLGTVLSDEFDASLIDTTKWEWKNPIGDCVYNLTANPGYLRITVPGNNHDLNIPGLGNQNTPRMLQNITGNFVIETKLLFNPVASIQSAGILLWSNKTYFIRFERGFIDSLPNQFIRVREALAGSTSGGWVEPSGKQAYSGSVTQLRVERTGNKFTFSYDPQDSTWTPLAFDAIPLDRQLSVGLFVVVQGNDNPIYVDFDYFRVFQGWPSAPRSLQATGGNRLITLSWLPPSDNGGTPITSYRIHRGNSTNQETYLTTIGNVTTYTDTDLTRGQEYYYRVSAVTGVGEGALSDEASATPLFLQVEGEEIYVLRAVIFIAAFLAIISFLTHRRSLNVRNIKPWLRERKREVAIVMGWTLAVTLILIRIYALFYARNPQLQAWGTPLENYAGPMFEAIDFVLLFTVSAVAGIMLVDMERIFYGYLASTISSFLIAVTYASLYIWYVLEWAWLSHVAFGWEWVVFWATSNMIRALLPFPLLLSFLAAFFGSMLRNWLKP